MGVRGACDTHVPGRWEDVFGGFGMRGIESRSLDPGLATVLGLAICPLAVSVCLATSLNRCDF